MRPVLLDLFCGAGGATKGYQDAGFYVVGVDNKPMPRYCGDEFVQADALEYLETADLSRFAAIHASPPCQDYSSALRGLVDHSKYPRLIEDTVKLLQGHLYVVENVPGSPIPITPTLDGRFGLMLCGTMLGLRRVRRHRYFLSSIPLFRPERDCAHRELVINPYSAKARKRDGIESRAEYHFANEMQIDWMASGDEIREAIPPAYTRYIGAQLLRHIRQEQPL